MVFKKIKTKGTLSDKAYKSIKENILLLKLKPGEVLLEDQLSSMLGISRTPIREALRKLKHEGLVTVTPGKGTHVTELTIEQFKDICDIRESLEILSIKLSCLNRSEKDIKKMRHLLLEQDDLLKQTKLDERLYLEFDRKLHIKIAESTKNALLVKYLIQINESYNRYLYFTKFESRASLVTNEHIKIVDIIEVQNINKAEILMKRHLKGVEESIYTALKLTKRF